MNAGISSRCRRPPARSGVDAFDLLDVEADIGDAVLDIEVEETFGFLERTLGQDRDHMERQALILQHADGAHRLRVGSLPRRVRLLLSCRSAGPSMLRPTLAPVRQRTAPNPRSAARRWSENNA